MKCNLQLLLIHIQFHNINYRQLFVFHFKKYRMLITFLLSSVAVPNIHSLLFIRSLHSESVCVSQIERSPYIHLVNEDVLGWTPGFSFPFSVSENDINSNSR